MARIPTAANVARAPSPRDPGVSVPAIGQEVARATAGVGNELSAIADRRRRTSEAVDRIQKKVTFQESMFQAYSDWERSGEVADLNSSEAFISQLNAQMRDTLGNHQGSDESQAQLRADLENIRLDYSFKASTASTLARRQVILESLDRDLTSTAGQAFQDPSQIGALISAYDDEVDGLRNVLSDTVVQEARTKGRAALVRSALDGAIARGDLASAHALVSESSPYGSALPASDARRYRAQIITTRRSQARQNEADATLARLERRGVPITPAIVAAVNRVPEWAFRLGQSAPSDTAKKVQELETALGRPLTEAETLEVYGLAPATDKPSATAKEIQEAEAALGRPLTPAEIAQKFGIAPTADKPSATAKEIQEAEAALGRPLTDAEILQAYDLDRAREQPSAVAKQLREFEQRVGRPATGDEVRKAYGQAEDEPNYTDPNMKALTQEIRFRQEQGLPPLTEDQVLALLPSGAGRGTSFGDGVRGQAMDTVTANWEAYSQGKLDPLQESQFESSVSALARTSVDRVSGTMVPGGVPPRAIFAIQQRGGMITEDGRLVFPNRDGGSVPAPAPRANASPGGGTPFVDRDPTEQETQQVVARADDPKLRALSAGNMQTVAGADLFGRADNIAGPIPSLGARFAGTPVLGDLLVDAPEMVQARIEATLVRDNVARALQQSPRFASMELNQIKQELGDFATAFSTPSAFKNRLIALDSQLARLQIEAQKRAEDPALPVAERQRTRTLLQDLEFAREALGVKARRAESPEDAQARFAPGEEFITPENRVMVRK
jgi:hypothetical protein